VKIRAGYEISYERTPVSRQREMACAKHLFPGGTAGEHTGKQPNRVSDAGLQLAGPFSKKPSAQEWYLTTMCSPEQALLNVLTNLFAGTSLGSEFGADTATNGSGRDSDRRQCADQLSTDFRYRYTLRWRMEPMHPGCSS
jgi:hypothetical protein